MASGEAAPAGAAVVTHARVLRIAVPMTLAYLSTPLLGFVDTTVIGRLGDAALLGGMRNWMLASVAIAGLVWALAMPVFGNHGLWLALWVFLAARGATLAVRLPGNLARAFA